MSDLIMISFQGLGYGMTYRDDSLNQVSSHPSPFPISGSVKSPNGDIFVVGVNCVGRCLSNGDWLHHTDDPDSSIFYTDITVHQDQLYISYAHPHHPEQGGVSIRNFNLEEINRFSTPQPITGITADRNNTLYLTSGSSIFQCLPVPQFHPINQFTYPNSSITYSGIVSYQDHLFVSYTGAHNGISVRTFDLNQIGFMESSHTVTGIDINEANDHLYLVGDNNITIIHALSGQQIATFTYPDSNVKYTSAVHLSPVSV